MEKITNKKFIDFIKSGDKKIQQKKKNSIRGDLLKDFETNIEVLETLVEKTTETKDFKVALNEAEAIVKELLNNPNINITKSERKIPTKKRQGKIMSLDKKIY